MVIGEDREKGKSLIECSVFIKQKQYKNREIGKRR
jgi:hypothetical protein